MEEVRRTLPRSRGSAMLPVPGWPQWISWSRCVFLRQGRSLTNSIKPMNPVLEAARQILSHSTSYHDHKETMAYSAVALQFGLLAAVMNMPPDRGWPFDYLLGIIGTLLWCYLHVFVRWQLWNRRIAALRISTAMMVVMSSLCDDTSERNVDWELARPGKSRPKTDHLWPTHDAEALRHAAAADLPKWFYDKTATGVSRTFLAEQAVSSVSFTTLALILCSIVAAN